MKMRRRWVWLCSAGMSLTLLAGCQTWVPVAGLTLPSGHYLNHPPQYIPPSPDFPLNRELATLEDAAARQGPPPAP